MSLFGSIGDALGLTDTGSEAEFKGFLQKSRNAAFDTAGALRKGGYDKQEAENLYQEQMPAIQEGAAHSARTAASGYGGRGLGNSGMALAAQNDVAMKQAIQTRLARLNAINAATGNQFKNNTAAMAGYNTLYGQDSGNYNQAASRNQAGVGSLTSLAATGAGAAMTGGMSLAPEFAGLAGMPETSPGIAMPSMSPMPPQGMDFLSWLQAQTGGRV